MVGGGRQQQPLESPKLLPPFVAGLDLHLRPRGLARRDWNADPRFAGYARPPAMAPKSHQIATVWDMPGLKALLDFRAVHHSLRPKFDQGYGCAHH
jgi:hypothetical protein